MDLNVSLNELDLERLEALMGVRPDNIMKTLFVLGDSLDATTNHGIVINQQQAAILQLLGHLGYAVCCAYGDKRLEEENPMLHALVVMLHDQVSKKKEEE